MRPDKNRRLTRVWCFRQLCASRSFWRRPSLFVWWLKEQGRVWVIGWLSINKVIRTNKGFMSRIKKFESSLNIFSPDFKLLWVFRKPMPNKIALHVAALDTQMKISFVLSQPPTQQRSCLPITECKNNYYKVIESLDFCILWGYFKSKLWQYLTVCKFVYICATSHLSRVSTVTGWFRPTKANKRPFSLSYLEKICYSGR